MKGRNGVQHLNQEGLNATLQDIIDSLGEQFFIIDEEYRVKYANKFLLENFASGNSSPVGQYCFEVFENKGCPCGSSGWNCPLPKVLKTGKPVVFNYSPLPGDNYYFQVTIVPLRDAEGNVTEAAEVRKDITQGKKMEQQVLHYHHHLQALNRISHAVSEMRDLDKVLNVCLDTALEVVPDGIGGIMFVEEKSKMLYYRVYRGLSSTYVDKMKIHVGEGISGRVIETGEPSILEDISQESRAAFPEVIDAEGLKSFASIPLKCKESIVGVMNLASSKPGLFTSHDLYLLKAIASQIGTAIEQARLYRRLERALERYQNLLKHALVAQENERKRIARELHDETTQAITSLTLSLQALLGMVEERGLQDEDFIQRLKKAHDYAVHTGNEIGRIMRELRPTLLETLGLAPAIQRYAKDTLEPKNINIETELQGTDKRFSPEIEITLFRITQGVIGNILEHSEAENAYIKLDCNDEHCVLNVTDDGRGFDVSKLTKVNSSGRGAGIFTMKERLKLVGGNCEIDSAPGKGTTVTAKVPLTGSGEYDGED